MADESNPRRELRSFNPEQISTTVRWIVGMAGMYLAARGYLTKEQVSTVSDALMIAVPALVTLGSAVWGILHKSDANIMASAASVPAVEAVVTSPAIANDVLKKEEKVLDRTDASIKMATADARRYA